MTGRVFKCRMGVLYTLTSRLITLIERAGNIGSMLTRRLRSWPNNKPALVQCLIQCISFGDSRMMCQHSPSSYHVGIYFNFSDQIGTITFKKLSLSFI